jgi:hypothetical protein
MGSGARDVTVSIKVNPSTPYVGRGERHVK